jgi:hypothetical protein
MSAVGTSDAPPVGTTFETRHGSARVTEINQRAVGNQHPAWDRDRLEFRLGSRILRQFKIPAPHEEMILAALEELNWPTRIDDPCQSPDDPLELERALASLNRRQRPPLVDFRLDAASCGIVWKLVEAATETCDD